MAARGCHDRVIRRPCAGVTETPIVLTVHAILPAIAMLALGASLLVPLRDNSYGRRATPFWSGKAFRAEFAVGEHPPADAPHGSRVTLREWLLTVWRRLRSKERTPSDDRDSCVIKEPGLVDAPLAEKTIDPEFSVCVETELQGRDVSDAPSESTACATPDETICVQIPHARSERIVPLTRLPLRRSTGSVAWPLLIPGPNDGLGRDARHRLLFDLTSSAGDASVAILIAAYGEEDAEGRVLVLRGLKGRRSDEVRSVLEHALRAGTDDERAIAVDTLVANGACDALTVALTDRVDAIAARAALGFVASRARDDYRVALARFIDSERIDLLLSLLAGYVR